MLGTGPKNTLAPCRGAVKGSVSIGSILTCAMRVTVNMNPNIAQHPHPHHTVIPSAAEGSAAAFRACSCGAKHTSPESKNPHPHLPFPAKTLGAPFIRGFIANGWESKTLNLLVHKGILESMATPCERARLQSCRKAPKKTLGFSPCRNTLTTRQL